MKNALRKIYLLGITSVAVLLSAKSVLAVCSWPNPWQPQMTVGDPLTVAEHPVAMATTQGTGATQYFVTNAKNVGASNFHIRVYKKSTCGTYVLDNSWSHSDSTRKNYAGGLAGDPAGNLWMAGWTTNSAGTDYKLVLRKRDVTTGVWSDANLTYSWNSGAPMQITGMVARNATASPSSLEVWMHGFTTETTGAKTWTLIRYQLSTVITRYNRNAFTGLTSAADVIPGFIIVDSSNRLWFGGGQEDTADNTHGIIQKEVTPAGGNFAIGTDYRSSTSYDSGDVFRGITFNGTTTVYSVLNYVTVGSTKLSKVFSAGYGTPNTLTAIETGWQLDPANSSYTTYTGINYNEALWVYGWSYQQDQPNNDIYYSFVRKGPVTGPLSNVLTDVHYHTEKAYAPHPVGPIALSSTAGIAILEGTYSLTSSDSRASFKIKACN